MASFNRFDICEAYVAYGVLYHNGQGSEEYRNMCRAQEAGNLHHIEPHQLSENGREIFFALGGTQADIEKSAEFEREFQTGECELCDGVGCERCGQ